MRPRELFGVIVRVMGFWFLTYSAYYALWIVWRLHGGEGDKYITVGQLEGDALIDMVRGLAILLLADPIVWIFYGLPPKKTSTNQDKSVDTES